MKNFLLLLLLFPLLASGQGFPEKPTNYVTVFDPFYTNESVLSKQEEELLNAKLRAFEDSTSNQLFVYLTYSLFGKNLEDHSREIFNTWGIGQKGKDNGILIAIFIRDRRYRIHVGYGLEAALPSDLCSQIQDEQMSPHFKDENFYKGIDAGIDQLIYYTKNKYEPRDPNAGLWPTVYGASAISLILFIINFLSLEKWKNLPKRKRKYLILSVAFLLIPLLGPLTYKVFNLTNSFVLMLPPLLGSFVSLLLCMTINDKDEIRYDNETDSAYERRMRMERERDRSSDSSDDSSSGSGGGGSSGSGGSSSSW